MSMPRRQAVEATHYKARCSDGQVRRFYAPTSAQFDSMYQIGYVMFGEVKVAGYIIPHPDLIIKHHFVSTIEPSPIPKSVVNGWVRPVNCCAAQFCNKCRRCVGGCRK